MKRKHGNAVTSEVRIGRGMRLAAVHPGAIEVSRSLKPSIPMTGHHGIEIRDELELEKTL